VNPSASPLIQAESPAVRRQFLLGLIVVLAVASLGTLVQQIGFYATFGGLYESTWTESQSIYAVWKTANGYPAYENPFGGNFVLSMYNLLFYASYGAVARLFGATDSSLLLVGRGLSLVFAVLCVVVHAGVMIRATARDGNTPQRAALCLACAVMLWLGLPVVSAWGLTVRPDIGAMLFVLLACLAVVSTGVRSVRAAVLCGLLFCCAWGFKQSAILTFGATVLALLIYRRDRGPVLVLVAAFVVPVLLVLLTAGPMYRANVLGAYKLSLFQGVVPAVKVLAYMIVENPLLFGVGIVTLIQGLARCDWRLVVRGEERDRDLWTLKWLVLVTLATLPLGFVSMFRAGSGPNNLFEAWIAITSLAAIGLSQFCAGTESRQVSPVQASLLRSVVRIAVVLLIIILPLQNLQPTSRGKIRLGLGLPVPRVWSLIPASEEEVRKRESLAQQLRSVPKPMLIFDEIFNQPWHSSDGQFPALVVIDEASYRAATAHGLISGDGLASFARERRMASVVIREHDPWRKKFEDAGYVQVGRLDSGGLLSHEESEQSPLVVLVPSAVSPGARIEIISKTGQ
jgi:hypothetical protein